MVNPKHLWKGYAIAIGAVFILATTVYATARYSTSVAERWSEAINESGRQRTLSQQILLFANRTLAPTLTPSERAEAEQDMLARIRTFRANHAGLVLDEDSVAATPGLSDELEALYFGDGENLDGLVGSFATAAAELPGLTYVAAHQRLDALSQLSADALLPKLDRAVSLFQAEAEKDLAFIALVELVAYVAMLIVLVLQALLIFRPAHRSIVEAIGRLQERAEEFERYTADAMAEKDAVEQQAVTNIELAEELHETRWRMQIYTEFLDTTLESIDQGIAVFDDSLGLKRWNLQLQSMLGQPLVEDIRPVELGAMWAPVGLRRLTENGESDPDQDEGDPLADPGGSAHFEYRLGDGRWVECVKSPMPTGGFVLTFNDITERRKAEAEITALAHYDTLTGLANRAYFNQSLDRAIERLGRDGAPLCVALIDLDRFKPINDTHGHAAGDAVLEAVGARMVQILGERVFAARLGGDEFAAFLDPREIEQDPRELLARLLEGLKQPVAFEGETLCVGASIGLALRRADRVDRDAIVRLADDALYEAKSYGRGVIREAVEASAA